MKSAHLLKRVGRRPSSVVVQKRWPYVRIRTFWKLLLFYYFLAPLCNRALGLESGRIPNARITSSSAYNGRYTAPNGRLHKPFCWIARHNNHNQWFKVDFLRTTTVRKIVTQGRRDANQWVTRYKLTYSLDTLHWPTYRQRSQDKVCFFPFWC